MLVHSVLCSFRSVFIVFIVPVVSPVPEFTTSLIGFGYVGGAPPDIFQRAGGAVKPSGRPTGAVAGMPGPSGDIATGRRAQASKGRAQEQPGPASRVGSGAAIGIGDCTSTASNTSGSYGSV